MPARPILVVHGGAGSGTRDRVGAARAEAGLAALRESLRTGIAVLAEGGPSLDAVVAAVAVLEDGEELNAGRGAALTDEGRAELSAAVADGTSCAGSARGGGGAFLRAGVGHGRDGRIRCRGQRNNGAWGPGVAEVGSLGGTGGCGGGDWGGIVAMRFTSPAMFRGWARSGD